MDAYQQFIYKSRYSRFLPDKNRRENWDETVTRYLDFVLSNVQEKHGFHLDSDDKQNIWNAIHNLEVMPSMRAMMTAGPALARDNVAGYNCLAGETKIQTKEYGLVPIKELVGKDVFVLTNGGKWVSAPIRSFGEQSLMKVKFAYNRHFDEVYATPDHDWLLTDGTRIKTKNLKNGMKIPLQFATRKSHYDDMDYRLGIIHGLIYGDGTAQKYKSSPQDKIIRSCERVKGYKIRICSDASELLKYFDGYPVSYPSSCGGDPVVYLYDNFAQTHSLKELPSSNETESYLVGFFRGWFAADGYVGKNGDVFLCGDDTEEQWIFSTMTQYGIVVKSSTYLPDNTNFGIRTKKSKNIKIWRPSFTAHDILIERKKSRFVPLVVERHVHSIIPTNRYENVYCATVPNEHNFVIENGIVTGNCTYLPVDDPKSFDEAMFILMCGSGVGFSVERQYINKLPEVPEKLFHTDTTIIVKDSKEGWAKALRMLLALLYSGEIPKWDTSKVRKAGAVLKTFGGRASGPEPLVELFQFIIRIFLNAQGRRLTSLECHDIMCKIGEVVVVGGVRRSAMISLSNLSDDRMRNAKSGAWWEANPQRSLSNNSAVYTEKPEVGMFLSEWLALYESKSGERGIFNREASEKAAGRSGRRDTDHQFGTNPCCFTKDMKLLTTEGYKTFGELEGQPFKIVNYLGHISNGKVWKVNRTKNVIRISFFNKDVDSIEATSDHIFKLSNGEECQAKDLIGKRPKRFVRMKTEPDPYHEMQFHAGFMLGDGILTDLNNDTKKGLSICIGAKDYEVLRWLGGHSASSLDANGNLYTQHNAFVARQFNLPAKKIGERGLPETVRNSNGLMGLFSANGCVIRQSRVALKTTDFEQANELVNTLADDFGISAYITVNKTKEQTFDNGLYQMKESYDVNIGRYLDIIKFAEQIGFVQKYKQEALQKLIDARAPVVKSLEGIGEREIYDFNEPVTNWGVVNGVVVHNSEIILRPYQMCNLSEVVVRSTDTMEDLERKVKIATYLGTFQSTFTHFPYLRKIWQKNTEEERLLGVSLTGIYDSPLLNDHTDPELPKRLERLRQVAVETNKILADALGIQQSAAITCVKPSGTVSQLTDAASGIHPRHDRYYIRRVRSDNKDPLTDFLKSMGVPNEPDVMRPGSTTVFSFYKKAPESAKLRENVSAIEHLNLWLIYQRHWCEHKPSVTINVKENEWPTVGAWVWENFDEVSGISFLPYDGGTYRQAPYETIDQETYTREIAFQPTVLEWNKMVEVEDNVEGVQTLACVSNSCEI